jgi:hypothetical protein
MNGKDWVVRRGIMDHAFHHETLKVLHLNDIPMMVFKI